MELCKQLYEVNCCITQGVIFLYRGAVKPRAVDIHFCLLIITYYYLLPRSHKKQSRLFLETGGTWDLSWRIDNSTSLCKMSTRPYGYGLTAETRGKISSKYSAELEQEAILWIEDILEDGVFKGAEGAKEVHCALKDGRILCRLINALNSSSQQIKFNDKEKLMPFKMMENIGYFLDACEKFGCSRIDLFQTADLYDNQNMHQVICAIHALGRKARAKGFNGPILGPKESEKNIRTFTEDQLKAGHTVIGLQMGSNKGANASGVNYGKQRDILH